LSAGACPCTLSFLELNAWALWGFASQQFSFAYVPACYGNPLLILILGKCEKKFGGHVILTCQYL
jgi:hypothetical protein